jgi:hypothetical protein
LDDRVLNDLLASPSFTGELLKAWLYADMSYRQYCALLVNRLENKSVRAFLHQPLHKKILVHPEIISKRQKIECRVSEIS